MRGRPAVRRTMRTSIDGENMRPCSRKRGAKSVTSMALPASSSKRVTRMAELRS
jgi:hypothetical protein